ncbi:hypothetical protein KIW84_075541 [Lathyrus oleraceus]|uniref:Uncharacterized protein n=1 Tax=Pisum sativum TaxID=3888 RepID=A0A9D4ZY93_PEA|nr:hypothetical protein KIW84_075541 [Pisum sativum]
MQVVRFDDDYYLMSKSIARKNKDTPRKLAFDIDYIGSSSGVNHEIETNYDSDKLGSSDLDASDNEMEPKCPRPRRHTSTFPLDTENLQFHIVKGRHVDVACIIAGELKMVVESGHSPGAKHSHVMKFPQFTKMETQSKEEEFLHVRQASIERGRRKSSTNKHLVRLSQGKIEEKNHSSRQGIHLVQRSNNEIKERQDINIPVENFPLSPSEATARKLAKRAFYLHRETK